MLLNIEFVPQSKVVYNRKAQDMVMASVSMSAVSRSVGQSLWCCGRLGRPVNIQQAFQAYQSNMISNLFQSYENSSRKK